MYHLVVDRRCPSIVMEEAIARFRKLHPDRGTYRLRGGGCSPADVEFKRVSNGVLPNSPPCSSHHLPSLSPPDAR